MRILSRLARWAYPTLPPVRHGADLDRMERYAAVADQIASYRIGRAEFPTFDVGRGADAYAKLALVYRCLDLITHAIGQAKVRVYDEADDDQTIPDHPMRALLRQPNDRMGEARFWGAVSLRAGIAGFAVAEKERNRRGDVIALNPLNSAWLTAIPRGKSVYDWEYRIPGVTPVPVLPAADTIVFNWADTADGSPYGAPPLATCLKDVAILEKLTNFLAVLFERGGVPLYGLIPDPEAAPMDQPDVDDMTERFVRRHGGLERSAIPMVLEGIKDVKRLTFDMNELAMEAIRDVTDADICTAFGIHPWKTGAIIGMKHTTENATAGVIDGAFYRDTILPHWSRFDDALTTGLLPEFEALPTTRALEFDTSDITALQEDRNEKARAMVVPGFAGGLLSNHMALRELGLPIPDGLPEYYLRGIAVEAIPADDPLQTATPTATTTPPPPQVGYNTASSLAYAESGVVDRIQMFDNASHATEPMGPTQTTCADRDGRIVPLGESDGYIASAHVNCQLAFAPVLIGEE